jgi:glycosyltransferase involved in cell wall biosynthesis
VKAAVVANVQLVLAGPFSFDEYQKQLEAMPEYSNVDYLGVLDRRELRNMLGSCDVGMATLLNVGQYNQLDNFGVKILEYAAAGLPVVLSKSPYHESVMRRHPFGICVNPECVEEIANAVNTIIDSPAKAKQMSEAGKKAVLTEFNWSTQEKKLLELYRRIGE